MAPQELWRASSPNCNHQRIVIGGSEQIEQGVNQEVLREERLLIGKLEDLWQKDTMFWQQRSKIWLQLGDRNSRFFHLTSIQRRQRNQIVRLRNGTDWTSGTKEIANIIRSHFQKLYQAPPIRDFEAVLSLVEPIITLEINASLTRPICREEIKEAVFQQDPLKAPGSDGFPGLFYQTYWDIVGDEVVGAVQSLFRDGVFLKELNHTNVTLIPKTRNPELINQYRPISLC